MHNIQTTETTANKFQSAEELWFWFCSSKKIRNGFFRGKVGGHGKVCEMMDVEALITKLYLAGRLTDAQLEIMMEFAEKHRAPHQYIYAENKKAALWTAAMHTIYHASAQKGWME
jgi:hypothetical protein